MSNRQWHYSQDGAQYGPVDEAEIIRLIQDGDLAPGAPVLPLDSSDWRPANSVPRFQVEVYPSRTQSAPVNAASDSMEVGDDERLYDVVADEFSRDQLKQGLWLKAQTKAKGELTQARILYTEWRVGQLTEEEVSRSLEQKQEQTRISWDQEQVEQARVRREHEEQEQARIRRERDQREAARIRQEREEQEQVRIRGGQGERARIQRERGQRAQAKRRLVPEKVDEQLEGHRLWADWKSKFETKAEQHVPIKNVKEAEECLAPLKRFGFSVRKSTREEMWSVRNSAGNSYSFRQKNLAEQVRGLIQQKKADVELAPCPRCGSLMVQGDGLRLQCVNCVD